MRMFAVDSQNLASVGYDPATKTLDVVFNAAPGWVYTYRRIGLIKFARLLTAESVGGYFQQAIRSNPKRHPYTRRKVG